MRVLKLLFFVAFCGFYVSSTVAQIVCPPLPLLQNGHYLAFPGAQNKVKIVCDPSYEYTHPKFPSRRLIVSKCRNGKWDDPAPKCHLKPNICFPPTPPEHGRVIGAEPYEAASVAHFHCDDGYYRKGPNQATCQGRNYEWTDYPPVCIEHDPTSIGNIASHLNKQFIDKMEQYSMGRVIDYNVEREGLDLFLVFDKSSSIPPDKFDEGIKFSKFLLSKFNVSNGEKEDIVGGTRLSVYTFGTAMKKEMSLDDNSISSTEDAIRKLNTIKCGAQCDGGTNMAEALRSIEYTVGKQTRPRAKKALFITSDGVPTYEPGQKPVSYYVEKIKAKDVEIFTVGIGNEINEEFLSTLASSPSAEHVFLLEKFEDFSEIITRIREEAAEPPPPAADKCGYVDKKHQQNISSIQDKDITLGQWPWLAAIIVNDRITNGTRFGCDGVIICSKWVLTNAKCLFDKDGTQLTPEEVDVVVGSTNLVEVSAHEQHFYAVNIIVHELFNMRAKKIGSDIALIELNDDVMFNEYVRPVCITSESFDQSSRPDAEGIIAGWLIRKEEDARLDNQPVRTIHAGQAKLRVSANDLCDLYKPKKYNCENLDMFHAAGRAVSDKKCYMINMGSPFFMNTNDRFHIAGVASHIEGCSLDKKSVMFTRVRPYVDWILIETDFCDGVHL